MTPIAMIPLASTISLGSFDIFFNIFLIYLSVRVGVNTRVNTRFQIIDSTIRFNFMETASAARKSFFPFCTLIYFSARK